MIPQIVVIDDDPIILKRAWNTLTSAGLKVVALKSGKALLEYIKDNSAPDLILMDISMPEMDGFETVKALKKSEAGWRDTPVIQRRRGFLLAPWILLESHLLPVCLCLGLSTRWSL